MYFVNTYVQAPLLITLSTFDKSISADVQTIAFYNQFQSHAMTHQVGIKPFLELQPGMDNYYKPSQTNMTKEEQEIEHHAFTSAVAGKLLAAMEGNNMMTLLTITMLVNNDGYKC